ncbi:MAG: hypothetical protein ACFCU1_07370 [Sumerlaeia bacterium]
MESFGLKKFANSVPLWLLEVSAAISLTVAQMLMTFAVICFVLASYALWGSPSTPLWVCFYIGIGALIVEFILNQLHNFCLREIIRREPKLKTEVDTWSTKSRVTLPKIKKENFADKDSTK